MVRLAAERQTQQCTATTTVYVVVTVAMAAAAAVHVVHATSLGVQQIALQACMHAAVVAAAATVNSHSSCD
jgi:hypothetical protein